MLNFENMNKMKFAGVPPYGIPEIQPEHIDIRHLEWMPFNYAKTAKNRESKGIHFYLDDYQFARLWNRPDDYISLLSEFGAVCTPDSSQYTDMPVAMRIYNHYRFNAGRRKNCEKKYKKRVWGNNRCWGDNKKQVFLRLQRYEVEGRDRGVI